MSALPGWLWTGYVKRKRCERCKSRIRLVVHHKDRDPLNNSDHSNLETLCRACHAAEHALEVAESRRREDVRQRNSASQKKNWTPEYRAKMVAVHNSPQALKRHSEATKRHWSDPNYRAKQVAAGQANLEENRAKLKALWANPTWRAKMLVAQQGHGDKMKALWADPVWRAARKR